MSVLACLNGYICACVGTHRDQGKALDPLERELKGVMNFMTWALGTQLSSSETEASVLNH